MADEIIDIKFNGALKKGKVLTIEGIKPGGSLITLEGGIVLKISQSPIKIVHIIKEYSEDGKHIFEFDQNGIPIIQTMSAPIVTIEYIPEGLKKPN
jgi:hypothetical protein